MNRTDRSKCRAIARVLREEMARSISANTSTVAVPLVVVDDVIRLLLIAQQEPPQATGQPYDPSLSTLITQLRGGKPDES